MFLTEKVFGNIAIGYHRTKNLQKLSAIKDGGFEVGYKGLYGPGVYFTYDFDDQQDNRMLRLYGQYIVKTKIALQDFIIFDEDVAKNVYREKNSLRDQLVLFNPKLGQEYFDEIMRVYQNIKTEREILYTSDLAKIFTKRLFSGEFVMNRPLNGIIFTGRLDGKVIVVYDQKVCVPFAYARVIDLEKTYEKVKWNKLAIPVRNVNDTERGVAQIQKSQNNIKIFKKIMVNRGYSLAVNKLLESTYYNFLKQFKSYSLRVSVQIRFDEKQAYLIEPKILVDVLRNNTPVHVFIGDSNAAVRLASLEFVLKNMQYFEDITNSYNSIIERYVKYVIEFLKLITKETPMVFYKDNGDVRAVVTKHVTVTPYNLYNTKAGFSSKMDIMLVDDKNSIITLAFGGGYDNYRNIFPSNEHTFRDMFSRVYMPELRMVRKLIPNLQISSIFTKEFKKEIMICFGWLD